MKKTGDPLRGSKNRRREGKVRTRGGVEGDFGLRSARTYS